MKIIYLLIIILSVSGCQAITSRTHEHAHSFDVAVTFSQGEILSNPIKVEIDEELAASLLNIYLERVRQTEKDDLLFVRGPLKKPLGKSLSNAYIRATFYNDQGDILSQKITKATSSSINLNGGLEDRFSLKTRYNSKIVRCKLEIIWRKDAS